MVRRQYNVTSLKIFDKVIIVVKITYFIEVFNKIKCN